MQARLLLMLGLALGSATGQAVEGQTTPVGQDALSSAVQRYNRNSGLASAFRLWQVRDRDPLNPDLQNLELILKETVCPNSVDLNLDDCDFKEHGEVKACSGTSSAQPGSPALQIQCDLIPPEVKRQVKLGRKVCKFFCRPLKLPPGGGSSIANIKQNEELHVA